MSDFSWLCLTIIVICICGVALIYLLNEGTKNEN